VTTPAVVRGGGAALLHHRIRAAGWTGSAGMVTAEFAVGLLAVVPLVLSLVALTGIGASQVQVVEAARTGARLLARGEPESVARAQVAVILPDAAMSIDRGSEGVSFEVSRRVGGQGMLPGFTLRASATTPLESP
jgi:hypothetical protein